MRTAAIIILVIASCVCARAQVVGSNPTKRAELPSALEIAHLFGSAARGDCDPFVAIPSLAKKGEKILPALRQVLFSAPTDSLWLVPLDTTASGRDSLVQDSVGYRSGTVFAEMAIEAIGTDSANAVLFETARSHPNILIRGKALDFFASIYHEQTLRDSATPPEAILQLLVLSAADSSQPAWMEKSIAQIAREGIQNWLGEDWGEVLPAEMKASIAGVRSKCAISDLGLATKSPNAIAGLWWRESRPALAWDKKAGHFKRVK